MKKFMILMLSLAVLFSFAACDNTTSNNGGNDDQASAGVPDSVVVDLATKTIPGAIDSALDATSGVFSSLTVTDGKLAAGYTLGDGYKSITYAVTNPAEGQRPETGATITLSGYATTSSNTTTVTLSG